MKKLIPALLLALSACYSAPNTAKFNNSREYPLSKNQAWNRAVEFFADKKITIRNIEKSSGVIYAEPDISNTKYADCGKFGTFTAEEDAEGAMRVNLFVKEIGEDKTKLKINTSFNNTFYNDPFIYGRKKIECQSTGVLEKEILDFVGE
jgi:hypothetical protein